MTREQQLARLIAELKAGNDGVFIIVSEQASILDGTSIPLVHLLDTPEIGAQLRAAPGEDPIEVPPVRKRVRGTPDPPLHQLSELVSAVADRVTRP
ncbi:hypothetical protein [Enhygromyxa salina]|uniref:Uncharacterized protein n=1 Tax=Enhygromyxa salina TaxID=215803 RepID=A0A2S9XUB5_9BACT|nr:hypothetical protein [Enhygromyxa salina]PRP96469.1 hypothetical protein ENSA7_72840 [Enhygromyxa salina]